MDFKRACRDIQSLKVQGATNVAVAAVNALSGYIAKSKVKSASLLIKDAEKARKILFMTRPTEPMMRNFLNFVMSTMKASETVSDMKDAARTAAREVLQMKSDAKSSLCKIGSGLIENGSVVYTHCHASSVTGILKEAAKKKKFEVYNTETRPRFQGRLTAAELAKAKIKVTHFVDSSAKLALKKADIMLIGADAITPTGVFNKIGSALFAEVARKYDVPVYVCTVAWKLDPESIFGKEEVIEERNPKEVWDKAPKGVTVKNYAFEKVTSELVSGVISELGVYSLDSFIEEAKKKYPWMF